MLWKGKYTKTNTFLRENTQRGEMTQQKKIP